MFKLSVHKFLYKWAAALLVLSFALGAAGPQAARAAGKTKTTTVVNFSAPAVAGSPVTVTATITPVPSGGTVTFTATKNRANVALSSACTAATVSGPTATCTFTPGTAGVYKFTAMYSGNTSFAKSNGSVQVTVLNPTTTVVTDNATTIPGGPAPVTFGGTIVFTAQVSSVGGAPSGTVQWTLSHDAPEYGAVGSGILGACQGDVPVVNGVATCSVTPGYWPDSGNGDLPAPFYWGIRATAVFTPAAGSTFSGSNGNDSTNKITMVGDQILPYCSNGVSTCQPFVIVSLPLDEPSPLSITGVSDSLGRNMVFYWCVNSSCPFTSNTQETTFFASAGLTSVAILAICPEGIGFYHQSFLQYWEGSFECVYPNLSLTLRNYQP